MMFFMSVKTNFIKKQNIRHNIPINTSRKKINFFYQSELLGL